jgi:hypothetical protein
VGTYMDNKNKDCNRVYWFMTIISTLRRLRQEVIEFKVSLGCIARHCHKGKKRKRRTIRHRDDSFQSKSLQIMLTIRKYLWVACM